MKANKLVLGGFFIFIILFLASITLWHGPEPVPQPDELPAKIRVAVVPPSFTTYSIYIAYGKGFFSDQGLDVVLDTSYPHGKATINAVINGQADIAASSETPFMHAILDGAPLYTIATTVTAEDDLALIARKDKGIRTPRDLKGKSIGVTIGSNGEYFLETVLLIHGMSLSDVKPINLKPNQMYETLINGKIDAIVTWNPQMHRARKDLGENALSLSSEGLYVPSFITVAKKDFVHSNPDMIRKFVKALDQASNLIQSNPGEALRIISQYFKIEKNLLSELSATYDFRVSLDQSYLLTLENQSAWAIQRKITRQTQVPNYLDFIYTDALKMINPGNVSIIE